MMAGKPLLDAPLTPEGEFWASQEERILHHLDLPARAPREVVERTREYLVSSQYRLPLIEWVSTPAGGFWQGAEYRFVLDTVAGRECWRVEKRNARSSEWQTVYHRATLERAIAHLWQQGAGWWRPHSAIRLWLQKVGLRHEDLSDPVEW